MKSKTTNIVLIIALIGIWGMVAYRFMNGMSSEEDVYVPTTYKTSGIEEIKQEEENYLINGQYRDPFLGKTHRVSNTENQTKTKKATSKPPKVIKPPIDWSFLVYRGDFMNEKKQHIGIISIRNRDFLAKEGDQKEAVSIVRILKDSILVNYQNEKKYIHKAKK